MEQNNIVLSPIGQQLREELDKQNGTAQKTYSDTIYTEVGEYYYRNGNAILALNCFNKAVSINASNQKAKTYAEMIREVLNFYHKDLLNP